MSGNRLKRTRKINKKDFPLLVAHTKRLKESEKAKKKSENPQARALRIKELSDILKTKQGQPSDISYAKVLREILLSPEYLNLQGLPLNSLEQISNTLEERIQELDDKSFDLNDDKEIIGNLYDMASSAHREIAKKVINAEIMRLTST